MNAFNLITILLILSAVFGYLNLLYFRLPRRIGVMLSALVFSLLLVVIGHYVEAVPRMASDIVGGIDFRSFLLNGILCFILFAGSIDKNLDDILEQKWTILVLSVAGVLISTFATGALAYWVFKILGLQVGFIYCLLFGALISPTDPISILGILREAGIPKSLLVKLNAEALFNDGVGVVIFVILLGMVQGHAGPGIMDAVLLFFQASIGGMAVGMLTGYLAYLMLRKINYYQVEITITIALTMGSYALSDMLGVSGPIAVVVAGLFIGNQGRMFAMSPETCHNLDTFWELLDEVLNSILFVLIGLEIPAVKALAIFFTAAAAMVPVVIAARWLSVAVPIGILKLARDFTPNAVKILTWGGLRGGLAFAMALSVPPSGTWIRDILLAATYLVVLFSILVQGLTIKPLIRSWMKQPVQAHQGKAPD